MMIRKNYKPIGILILLMTVFSLHTNGNFIKTVNEAIDCSDIQNVKGNVNNTDEPASIDMVRDVAVVEGSNEAAPSDALWLKIPNIAINHDPGAGKIRKRFELLITGINRTYHDNFYKSVEFHYIIPQTGNANDNKYCRECSSFLALVPSGLNIIGILTVGEGRSSIQQTVFEMVPSTNPNRRYNVTTFTKNTRGPRQAKNCDIVNANWRGRTLRQGGSDQVLEISIAVNDKTWQ